MSDRLCVVMPVYNEQDAIGPVLEKWDTALKDLGIDYEIRPYNDGSKDGSLKVMHEVSQRLGERINVRDKKNGGHGNTILTGYREAANDGFDWVFQIDSDDEMGPEKFNELWSHRNDYDFLVGIRDGRVQALPRKIISFVSRLCVRIFYGKSVWDVNTPYRLMRVSVFRGFYSQIPITTFAPNVILSGLAARHKLRCFETRVPQHDRTTGEVSIKKWKLLKAAALSFRQTITFSFSLSNRSLLGTLLFVFLLVFSFSCLMSWLRVVMTLCLIGLLCMGTIRRLSCLGYRFIMAHYSLTVWSLFLFSLLVRACFAIIWPQNLTRNVQIADSAVLLDTAEAFVTTGSWLVNKSWVTVLWYSGAFRLFGINMFAVLIANFTSYALLWWVTVKFANKHMCRWVSVLWCFVYGFTPWLVVMFFRASTEHTYALFIMLSLFIFSSACSSNHSFFAMIAGIVTGCFLWCAVWSRGEAIIFFAASFAVLGIKFFVEKRKKILVSLGIGLSISMLAGGLVGWHINNSIEGAKTIFCSYDSLWPRLYGSNYNSKGRGCIADKVMIYNRWLDSHPSEKQKGFVPSKYFSCLQDGIMLPDSLANRCPPCLVPYIKDEIAKRWKSMSVVQIVELLAHKFSAVWQTEYILINIRSCVYRRIAGFICSLPVTVVIIGLICFSWRRIVSQSMLEYVDVGLLYFCGFVLLLMLTEASARYSFNIYLLGVLFAGCGYSGIATTAKGRSSCRNF